MPRILAFDHGTSGIKAALVDGRGQVLDFAYVATDTQFLPDGGSEQDPEQWWTAAVAAARTLLGRDPESAARVQAVAVSSTFSTTVAVDADGKPVLPALTWMDSRGAAAIQRRVGGMPSVLGYNLWRAGSWLRRSGGAPSLSGKDDAAHVALIRDRWPEAYERTALFLSSKDYLNLRLTGIAAATYDSVQLFWVTNTRDANDVHYDEVLLRRLGLDADKLPPLRGATEILGQLTPKAAAELGLSTDVRVVAGSADHQCALLGSGAVGLYEAHLYVGTSSWIECLVPFRKTDALHSIASFPTFVPGVYQCINEQDLAGGALEFLNRNVLDRCAAWLGATPPESYYDTVDRIASTVPPGSRGVLFAPWLNGERTPVDDTNLRGSFFGLSTTTTLDDLVRAVLEGVACNTRWSFQYVERFTGRRLDPIRFIGGGAQSDLWCQIFADVLQRDIHRVANPRHANARGAALLAGLGLGWIRLDEVGAAVPCDRIFRPQPENAEIYTQRFQQLVALYQANRKLFRRMLQGKRG